MNSHAMPLTTLAKIDGRVVDAEVEIDFTDGTGNGADQPQT
jgi:hypothetical protein